MIKGKTGLTVFLEFVEREGRMPTKDEFVDIGYSAMTFYRARNQYYDYLNEEIERNKECEANE